MSTQQGLLVLLVLAVFVIYVILGVLYESFIHPITILTGLPFAAFGALVTLDLRARPRHVRLRRHHHADRHRREERDHDDRLRDRAQKRGEEDAGGGDPRGGSVRFRPIMMTTMAALMGAIPIALGWGAGAATRRPLGVAVVGGLAFSQLVTLYVTPVFYTYFDELQERWTKETESPVAATAPVTATAPPRPVEA